MDEEAKRLLGIMKKDGALAESNIHDAVKLAYISARIIPFLEKNGVDPKSIQSMDDLDNKGDLNAATIEADFTQAYKISNTTKATMEDVCGRLPQKFKQLSGQGKPPSRVKWADKKGLPLEEQNIIPNRKKDLNQPTTPPPTGKVVGGAPSVPTIKPIPMLNRLETLKTSEKMQVVTPKAPLIKKPAITDNNAETSTQGRLSVKELAARLEKHNSPGGKDGKRKGGPG